MNKITLPFAEWIPDNPEYGDGYNLIAENVIPTSYGYRSFLSPVAMPINSFNEMPLGRMFTDLLSTIYLTVVGTSTKIYARLSGNYVDVSKSGGYSTGIGWDFCRYANYIIACNGVDPVQYATVDNDSISNFQDLPTSIIINGATQESEPPLAKYCEVVGNFLFLYNLATNPSEAHCSALDNPLWFPPLGSDEAKTNLSSNFIFPFGGSIQAIRSGISNPSVLLQKSTVALAIVLQERSISLLQLTNDTAMVFNQITSTISNGCIAPYSVAVYKGLLYFLAEDGFYSTDGSTLTNISEGKIQEWFRTYADDIGRINVKGSYDPYLKILMFSFKSSSSTSTSNDKILIYSPSVAKWSIADVPSCMLGVDSGRGITLDDIDSRYPAYNLDTLPFSLDSKLLVGSVPQCSIWQDVSYYDDTNTLIPLFQESIFTGEPMQATLMTNEFSAGMMLVQGVRPLIDYMPLERNKVIIENIGSDYIKQDGSEDFSNNGEFYPASPLDGIHRGHFFCRYAKIKVTIPASPEVDWTKAMGIELFYQKDNSYE